MADDARHGRGFSEIGGHPALDLVNTVEWRLSPARFEEDLLDYEHVLRWARQLRMLDKADAAALQSLAERLPADAREETARVRRLRESIYAVLFEAADPETVVAEYRDAVSRGRLTRLGDGGAWEFPVDLALPRRKMAVHAFDLLTRADLSRLGQCQDAECGWVFLDSSPRHNRRWCVSADCGNRNRVRDFYDRSRAAK
jgi:predicted RNA-binding Zn ribbon-like protein